MYLRRWEVRQVGKWNTEIENPHNYSFLLKSNAIKRARQNNEIANRLESFYKYIVVDKLTGECYNS